MRLFPGLLGLALLAGCATPYERCMAPTLSQLRTVERLMADTEANIARGFAVERRQDVVYDLVPCRDFDNTLYFCRVPVTVDVARPVAIDRSVEEGKLATLRDRRAELRAQVPRLDASCRAQFPAD